jgi:HlyD family secretion protein
MKKLITSLVFIMLLGAGVYAYYKYGRTEVKPQVIQAAVSTGDIVEGVVATGTVQAVRTVNVGSQVSGQVKNLYADFNTIVKKDMIIAELDPTLLQVQVKVQEANIERQKADILNLQLQVKDAQRTLTRVQTEFDKSLVTKADLDTAQLKVDSLNASIDSSQKMLVQAQANLDQANLNVQYCTIRSPIDGVVINRVVDIGQTVQASMNTPNFFTLATDLTQLHVEAGVDEADVGKIRRNQDVRFGVDAYQGQIFHGTISSVRLNPTTVSNVVTYTAVIDVKNPDLKLRPGMTANLTIVIETAANVTRVPNQATRFRPSPDMYTALGLTPPSAGQRTGAAGPGASTPSAATDQKAAPSAAGPQGPASAPAAGLSANQGGTANQGQAMGNNPRPGGRGFGGQTNLTPDQIAQMQQRFGRGRNGQRPAANETTGPIQPITERNATAIDELFAPVQRPQSSGQVWTWNETAKELKQVRVRLGVTDGQYSELLSGDLQPGQQVVTGIILPITVGATGTNPLMSPQRGGQPGMQPGRPGGGGGGGGRGGL